MHELGHFLVAKACGVRVLKFSLGFGSTLVGKTIGETEYVISAIPLGGYVKMYGENPDEQDVPASEKEVSFAHKSVLQRFGIVFAGPAFNFIFPVALFFFLYLIVGLPELVNTNTTIVGAVMQDSPAENGGMKQGDVIIEINGHLTEQWTDVLDRVKESDGNELTIVVLRDQQELGLKITPKVDSVKNEFGEELEKRHMIGIMRHDDINYQRVGPVDALVAASKQTWMFMELTAKGFIKIVSRDIPASQLGGPILIAQIAGKQMQEGWVNFLYFMGLLSVNLGVLNLLPVPVLDGGHLMFLTIEAIRRKPMTERAQIIAQQIGLSLLLCLMVFVFYNDIARIIGQ